MCQPVTPYDRVQELLHHFVVGCPREEKNIAPFKEGFNLIKVQPSHKKKEDQHNVHMWDRFSTTTNICAA